MYLVDFDIAPVKSITLADILAAYRKYAKEKLSADDIIYPVFDYQTGYTDGYDSGYIIGA